MMTREQVFSLIRSHLADELEVDPDRISESTRFKEDLTADSLDLYTLVQELEDSYGVKISDEEASKILTVGQTVDFVLASRAGAPISGARSANPAVACSPRPGSSAASQAGATVSGAPADGEQRS